jgi:hypothetical protein
VTEYPDYQANQIKHMEMTQAVISRLASNSFLIKGWALTLVGAFLGFGVNRDDWALAAASTLPIAVFWLLDTYYLRAERLFRVLYDEVRTGKLGDPFFMAATKKSFVTQAPDAASSSWQAFSSKTLLGFYLPLAAATAIVEIIIAAR